MHMLDYYIRYCLFLELKFYENKVIYKTPLKRYHCEVGIVQS